MKMKMKMRMNRKMKMRMMMMIRRWGWIGRWIGRWGWGWIGRWGWGGWCWWGCSKHFWSVTLRSIPFISFSTCKCWVFFRACPSPFPLYLWCVHCHPSIGLHLPIVPLLFVSPLCNNRYIGDGYDHCHPSIGLQAEETGASSLSSRLYSTANQRTGETLTIEVLLLGELEETGDRSFFSIVR